MIGFQPTARAALDAAESVAPFRGNAQRRPPAVALHGSRVAEMFQTQIAARLGFAARPAMRAPSATASTLADAASMRPLLRALASLTLFDGSRRQTASAKAERNSNDGAAFTSAVKARALKSFDVLVAVLESDSRAR